MNRKKRLLNWGLLGACIISTGLCSGCGSKEEEIPMGRYTEREVKLPGTAFT